MDRDSLAGYRIHFHHHQTCKALVMPNLRFRKTPKHRSGCGFRVTAFDRTHGSYQRAESVGHLGSSQSQQIAII